MRGFDSKRETKISLLGSCWCLDFEAGNKLHTGDGSLNDRLRMKLSSSSTSKKSDQSGAPAARRAWFELRFGFPSAFGFRASGLRLPGFRIIACRGPLAGVLAVVCFALAPAGAAEADAFQRAKEGLAKLDVPALVRAVADLQASYPGKYPDGAAMLEQLKAFEKDLPALAKGLENSDKDALARYSTLAALRQKALLSNPLLDFEQMLIVKRRENNLALPQNWQGNSSLNPHVENEICLLPVQGPDRPAEDLLQAVARTTSWGTWT